LTQPLWRPSATRVAQANVTAFQGFIERRYGLAFVDYSALHSWSVHNLEDFWSSVWEYAEVIGEPGDEVLRNGHRMPGAQWFPNARLNFAANLLRRRDNDRAIIFRGEDQVAYELSYRQLHEQTARLAARFREAGVGPGDRVAGYLPNMPEAVVGMLAAASIGAVWCSCSPDFGVEGVLDRFGQIEPKVLIAADGVFYAGQAHDCMAKIHGIQAGLPSLALTVVVAYTQNAPTPDDAITAVAYAQIVEQRSEATPEFTRLPFDHPLYIMFSSGTTGPPKCIVHGAGGTLLQHLKEHRLHSDVKSGDRLFYYTTCSWMMWNWLVSGLASNATLILYDGSPFYPNKQVLWDLVEERDIGIFGTSAKYLDAMRKAGVHPAETHQLDSLKTVLSTGSPLSGQASEFVYKHIKGDLCLSSISGGTDIVSCFVLGNPTLPVYPGEAQCRGLGLAVEVWDERGQPVRGVKGELVCTRAFPCMPVGFWNDPDDRRYRAAYFDTFPGVWHHGDYVELTEHDGVIFHGRSDAVLNPGGVRIGTAEIYRQVESVDEVVESLAIGQGWGDDVRIVLFVRLREGLELDDALRERLRDTIRRNATPRHEPKRILKVSDIPRTQNGKIVEIAVRDAVHGRTVTNASALANPGSLSEYSDREELAT